MPYKYSQIKKKNPAKNSKTAVFHNFIQNEKKNKITNKIRKMHAISSRDVKRKKMMQKKKEKEKRRSLKNLRHGFGGVRKWSTL